MPAAKPKRKSGWLWNQPLPKFDWDDPEDERGNYVHATRHGVSADEIEEAFSYDLQRSLPSKNPRNREKRAVLFSRTTDNAPVVVVTAHGNLATAIQAMEGGAYDYLAKPFKKEDIKLVVKRGLEHRRLLQENARFREELKSREQWSPLVGSSPAMMSVYKLVARVAMS
ncbi:MAG: response regulator, partial [Thermaceae bacterium]|nr:response regulator [Thermaceae bacterium]